MNDDVYLGNGEVVACGGVVGRYGGMLPQPVFKGADINAVGHRKFFQQPRTRVQAGCVVGHGRVGFILSGRVL